jgi:hypothetical protein
MTEGIALSIVRLRPTFPGQELFERSKCVGHGQQPLSFGAGAIRADVYNPARDGSLNYIKRYQMGLHFL